MFFLKQQCVLGCCLERTNERKMYNYAIYGNINPVILQSFFKKETASLLLPQAGWIRKRRTAHICPEANESCAPSPSDHRFFIIFIIKSSSKLGSSLTSFYKLPLAAAAAAPIQTHCAWINKPLLLLLLSSTRNNTAPAAAAATATLTSHFRRCLFSRNGRQGSLKNCRHFILWQKSVTCLLLHCPEAFFKKVCLFVLKPLLTRSSELLFWARLKKCCAIFFFLLYCCSLF